MNSSGSDMSVAVAQAIEPLLVRVEQLWAVQQEQAQLLTIEGAEAAQ